MKKLPIKIGVAGTHSTGKSTFLETLSVPLKEKGLRVGLISNIASMASDAGFPILRDHTFESTLWIMAECMKQEAEASLTCDVVLVDRPVIDALGYLHAALEVSGRSIPSQRLGILQSITRGHTVDYDMLVITQLDERIPLGEGRDQDEEFRTMASKHISLLAEEIAPDAVSMNSKNTPDVFERAFSLILSEAG